MNLQKGLEYHNENLAYAITKYQQAITLTNISDVLRLQNRPQEALEPALNALELDPKNEANWMYVALALAALKEEDALKALFRTAPGIFSDDCKVWVLYRERYPEFEQYR